MACPQLQGSGANQIMFLFVDWRWWLLSTTNGGWYFVNPIPGTANFICLASYCASEFASDQRSLPPLVINNKQSLQIGTNTIDLFIGRPPFTQQPRYWCVGCPSSVELNGQFSINSKQLNGIINRVCVSKLSFLINLGVCNVTQFVNWLFKIRITLIYLFHVFVPGACTAILNVNKDQSQDPFYPNPIFYEIIIPTLVPGRHDIGVSGWTPPQSLTVMKIEVLIIISATHHGLLPSSPSFDVNSILCRFVNIN